jgi:hypothetical protein
MLRDCNSGCGVNDCDHVDETITVLKGRDFVRIRKFSKVT